MTELLKKSIKFKEVDKSGGNTNWIAWLEAQLPVGDKAWCLAWTNDRLYWGQVIDSALCLASEDGSTLSSSTPSIPPLMEARLFGDLAEVRVWRTGDEINFIRIEDQEDDQHEAFDREYLLWGTEISDQQSIANFTRVVDGALGMPHFFPEGLSQDVFLNVQHPLHLKVRYYLGYENEMARITASRLVAACV